jgi:hypothetical protein
VQVGVVLLLNVMENLQMLIYLNVGVVQHTLQINAILTVDV